MTSPLDAAYSSVMSGVPVRQAAREHGVSRATLRYRLQTRQMPKSTAQHTALCLYDIHYPHEDKEHIGLAIEDAKTRYNIDTVVLGGDIVDCESISRFGRGHDTMPLREEIDYATIELGKLRGAFPKSRICYIKGNHEARLQRYLWDKATEIATLKGLTLQEQLELSQNNIHWYDNDQLKREHGTYFRLGRLNILHGHELGICPRVNPAHRYLQRAKSSLMVGHIHRSDTATDRTIDNKIIGCECVGTLADLRPEYRPQNDWIAGFAVVQIDADGYFRVDNRKIIDGRVV